MTFSARLLPFVFLILLNVSPAFADIYSTQKKLESSPLLQQVTDPKKTPYAQYVLQQTGIQGLYYAIHPQTKLGHFFVTEGLEFTFEKGQWYRIDHQKQHLLRLEAEGMTLLQNRYLQPALNAVKPLHTFIGTQPKLATSFLLVPFPCDAPLCKTLLETLGNLEKDKKLKRNIRLIPLLDPNQLDTEETEILKKLWCKPASRNTIIKAFTQSGDVEITDLPENCKSAPTSSVRLFERIFQVPTDGAVILNFSLETQNSQALELKEGSLQNTIQLLLAWLARF